MPPLSWLDKEADAENGLQRLLERFEKTDELVGFGTVSWAIRTGFSGEGSFSSSPSLLTTFDSNCFTEGDTKPANCITEGDTKPDGRMPRVFAGR